MQKLVRILGAAILIGIGIWCWRVFFPSPEKAIRSHLANLAETVSFEPKDGEVAKGLKARSLRDFFTPDATFAIELRGYGTQSLSGRDDLQQAALGYMHTVNGLKAELLDIHITLDPDKQGAVANMTAKATVLGEKDFYVQEMNFRFKKVEGSWLIYSAETVKTLNENQRGRKQAAG